jgi:hypothetical protein
LHAAITHPPPEHAATAFGSEQVLPQAPQWLALVFRFVSQPSAVLPLQLPQPALQPAIVHAPLEQPGVPLAMKHALPQAPQWETLVLVLTSQPFAALPSQSL